MTEEIVIDPMLRVLLRRIWDRLMDPHQVQEEHERIRASVQESLLSIQPSLCSAEPPPDDEPSSVAVAVDGDDVGVDDRPLVVKNDPNPSSLVKEEEDEYVVDVDPEPSIPNPPPNFDDEADPPQPVKPEKQRLSSDQKRTVKRYINKQVADLVTGLFPGERVVDDAPRRKDSKVPYLRNALYPTVNADSTTQDLQEVSERVREAATAANVQLALEKQNAKWNRPTRKRKKTDG